MAYRSGKAVTRKFLNRYTKAVTELRYYSSELFTNKGTQMYIEELELGLFLPGPGTLEFFNL